VSVIATFAQGWGIMPGLIFELPWSQGWHPAIFHGLNTCR